MGTTNVPLDHDHDSCEVQTVDERSVIDPSVNRVEVSVESKNPDVNICQELSVLGQETSQEEQTDTDTEMKDIEKGLQVLKYDLVLKYSC